MDFDASKLDPTNKIFKEAVDFVNSTDRIVYLTGKAGTGKTTFLQYIKSITKTNTAIVAPTGVAAINAGGVTVHSFFQIPFGPFAPNDKRLRTRPDPEDDDKSTIYDHFKYQKEKMAILSGLELLIIDEISMVRCDLLDVIDKLLRVFCKRRPGQPFGGVQVILIGDTFQLPPVASDEEWDILSQFYETPFFFSSRVIQKNKPVYIELKKIYRQSEPDFIELLNRVRINKTTDNDLQNLNNKYNPSFSPDEKENYITLATHNKLAENINRTKLDSLKAAPELFEGTITNTFPDQMLPTNRILHLKEGAQIMYVKNDVCLSRYFNGKIGKIKELQQDNKTIEFADGTTIELEKVTWYNIKYTWNNEKKKIDEEIIGTFTQYPIKLAWAITVHKSQGLTFNKVYADLRSAFASGQVYVALSRCTSFKDLVLKTRINRECIKTDKDVIQFAQNEIPETLIVEELKKMKVEYSQKESQEIFGVTKVNIMGKVEENWYQKRIVLAACIINQSLDDTQLGNVKFEKILHLSDYYAIKRNFNQNYLHKAAGPFDNNFTYGFFKHVDKKKWFKRIKRGMQHFFEPGQLHGESTNIYDYFSNHELERVHKLISYFKNYNYEQPEIVSTLYAVWNNRIIQQETLTDNLLIEDFYGWSENKKKYELWRLENALQWMRQECLVPDGWGRVIKN